MPGSLLQHIANALVGISGLVYAYARYLAEKPPSEFGNPVHPWEESLRVAHLITAPVLVFAVGLIWNSHVMAQFHQSRAKRRRSGLAMMGNALPMVFSGYLIQTAVLENWRRAWIWIHLITAGLWIFAYLAHLRGPLKRRINRRLQARS
ncbi:MAG: hypothetical protein JNL01_06535 [Bdellovibrionales bacterium]|nr:hypothetical protein [Bdellovibrionales bacterium]